LNRGLKRGESIPGSHRRRETQVALSKSRPRSGLSKRGYELPKGPEKGHTKSLMR